MSNFTTHRDLRESLELDAGKTSVTRAVVLAKCLRCGGEWIPRVAVPAKCPHCFSSLWNVERAQQLPGKPAPTRKGKPRGAGFSSGADVRRNKIPPHEREPKRANENAQQTPKTEQEKASEE